MTRTNSLDDEYPKSRAGRMGALRRMMAALATAVLASAMASSAQADSRILATGGATNIEGAAGGGIVPWAVLAGYGSSGEVGASAFATFVPVNDYTLNVQGAAISFENRVELSFARQKLDISSLGLPFESLKQNIFGMKVRLFGDLIYETLPQVSFGVMMKQSLATTVPSLVSNDESGVDFYLAASKLWLAGLFDRNVFANLTLRNTNALQNGLLGFGEQNGDDQREIMVEASGGIFLNRYLAVGAEYRQMPKHDNNALLKGNDWYDIFVAWFPNKHTSVVAAYADIGTVATQKNQEGFYVSFELKY